MADLFSEGIKFFSNKKQLSQIEAITFQGKETPININYHQKKRPLVIHQNEKILITLSNDLSFKQSKKETEKAINSLFYKKTKEKCIKKLDELLKKQTTRINKIKFKKMSSRWGSCSTKKNLNFNTHLFALPEDLQDYIIIHEFAHLFEMNHKEAFWRKVCEFSPNYKEQRKALREFEKKVLQKTIKKTNNYNFIENIQSIKLTKRKSSA